MNSSGRFLAAVITALVAAAFSATVLGLMGANWTRGQVSGPLNAPQLAVLKARAMADPSNKELRERIREMDLRIRREFFLRRQISKSGAFLAAGGLAVLIGALGMASASRERLPHPEPVVHDARVVWLKSVSASRKALIVGSALLAGVGGGVAAMSGAGGLLQAAMAEKPAGGPVARPTPPAEAYPSWDDIRRNWPSFRGPGGAGVSAFANAPVSWNGASGEGIRWKAAVSSPGKSSPVVWGDRIFLTGSDGTTNKVMCFSANTGQVLWEKEPANVERKGNPPEVMAGYAASSPATDGKRVYAVFANGDLAAFDFEGKQAWATNLGTPDNTYGHASSLVTWRNTLIIQFDQAGESDGKSKLLGIDGATGKTLWETPRPVGNSWASPIVARVAGGEEIITCGNPWVIGYEPGAGKELWRANCLSGDVAPSPIAAGGKVFATVCLSGLCAIPAGKGDLSEKIAWRGEDGIPDVCSPASDGKRVWVLTSSGTLTCYAADDGWKLWEQELEMPFSASPGIAGSRLYVVSEKGVTFIVEINAEKYVELGKAEIGENTCASPVFLDGRIYLRGTENLYCIGAKEGAKREVGSK